MTLKIAWAHKCSNQQPMGLVSMADQIKHLGSTYVKADNMAHVLVQITCGRGGWLN